MECIEFSFFCIRVVILSHPILERMDKLMKYNGTSNE